jgi:hypothetical protein
LIPFEDKRELFSDTFYSPVQGPFREWFVHPKLSSKLLRIGLWYLKDRDSMGEFVTDKDFDKWDEMFSVTIYVIEQSLKKTVTVFYLVYHYYSA